MKTVLILLPQMRCFSHNEVDSGLEDSFNKIGMEKNKIGIKKRQIKK